MPDKYLIDWQPKYRLGIEVIDTQHRALVALIRQLQEAMEEGRGRAFQHTLIERLVTYTIGHFRFEENLMRQHGYESLAEHTEMHRVMTSQVRELQQKIHDGGAVSNAALMLFLRTWLTDHIMTHDRMYAQAFNSKTAE